MAVASWGGAGWRWVYLAFGKGFTMKVKFKGAAYSVYEQGRGRHAGMYFCERLNGRVGKGKRRESDMIKLYIIHIGDQQATNKVGDESVMRR